MKKFSLFTAIVACAILLTSCGATSTLQKDIKYMGIRFKPLSRNDITLVGNLESSCTISGKVSKSGKVLDKEFRNNLKKGLINKSEATEIMYFAPGPGESITGSLYESEVFNSVYASLNLAIGGQSKKSGGILGALFPRLFASIKKPVPADFGMEFAYYTMIQKYPDVDYFINVRFDRKTILTGSKFSETVIVKADGVKLKTD